MARTKQTARTATTQYARTKHLARAPARRNPPTAAPTLSPPITPPEEENRGTKRKTVETTVSEPVPLYGPFRAMAPGHVDSTWRYDFMFRNGRLYYGKHAARHIYGYEEAESCMGAQRYQTFYGCDKNLALSRCVAQQWDTAETTIYVVGSASQDIGIPFKIIKNITDLAGTLICEVLLVSVGPMAVGEYDGKRFTMVMSPLDFE